MNSPYQIPAHWEPYRYHVHMWEEVRELSGFTYRCCIHCGYRDILR